MLNSNNTKNKLFLTLHEVPGESKKKFITNLFNNLTYKNFCHTETDRQFPNETLYCFKLDCPLSNDKKNKYFDWINEHQLENTEEVLLKFKFKHINGKIVFFMSYHYPTKGYEPWTYLFDNN